MMDYLELLEHSYKMEIGINQSNSRLEYLSEFIFDFTTYDSEKSVFFGRKAIQVCAAINDRKTFNFISNDDNHMWFLIMCNMPFFADRLEWGTSIRGAWWGTRARKKIQLDSCGLWINKKPLNDTLTFNIEEWKSFISTIIKFSEN